MIQVKRVKLSEVCQIKPPKKEAKEKLSETDPVSFVPMSNLGICDKDILLTEERSLKKVYGGYTYFADHDVLLAKITPCFENGKIGIAKGLINGIGFGSSEYIVFRTSDHLNPDYLFYYLSQESFRRAGTKLMSGAVGHKRVPKEFIENHEILLPPLPEQKRIVSILDNSFIGLDQVIANTEKNLANARELFESYLNNVFTQKGSGWAKKHIAEVCDNYGRGKSKHRPRNDKSLYGGNYPFIQTGDISKADHIINRYSQTYSEKGLTQSKLWEKGTVCIAIVGATIGESGILGFDACFPDSVIGFNLNRKLAHPSYVQYMFQHYKPTIKSKGSGTARPNINLGTFDKISFPIPSLEVQQEILTGIKNIADNSEHLQSIYQQKLKSLQELKQSILQKAFTGELTADYVQEQVN